MALQTFTNACSLVFKNKKNLALSLFLSAVFFFFYVSVPVLTVPGNSYSFFISATPPLELAFILVLSLLIGILFSMHFYAWKHGHQNNKNAALGISGFFAGIFASIFSTATCISCVSVLFSFLGFGGILFLAEHKSEITALSSVFVISALFFTSKKITGECKSCKVR